MNDGPVMFVTVLRIASATLNRLEGEGFGTRRVGRRHSGDRVCVRMKASKLMGENYPT